MEKPHQGRTTFGLVMDNLPLICENKRPTQRVKMKPQSLNPGQTTMGKVVVPMMDSRQIPLNCKANSGPVSEDDVEIPGNSIDDSNFILKDVVFHKGKLTPHPTHPVQRQKSEAAIINTKAKKIDNSKPLIIGIKNDPDFDDVLTTKSKNNKCPLKRRLDNGWTSVVARPESYNRDEIKKTREVMEMADAFKRDQDSFSKVVILDQKLDEHDLSDCLRKPMKLINEGTFGQAYKTNLKGQDLVAKKVKLEVDHKEILIPYKLSHPGIVRMLGVICVPGHFFIFMEDAGVSLKKWVRLHRSNVDYVKATPVPFSLSLFSIISWLEKHGIAHRDIKPENICISMEKNTPKLIDFGSAQTKQDLPCLMGHTHEFLPPFMNYLIWLAKTNQPFELGHQFMEQKSDNYAMALVIIWIWLGGRHPISKVNEYNSECGESIATQRMNVMKQIMGIRDDFFQPFLALVPEPLRTALKNSLLKDVKHRWDATQVCHHLEKASSQSAQKKLRVSVDDSESLDDFFGKFFGNTPQQQQMKPVVKCPVRMIVKPKETPAMTHNILLKKTQEPSITFGMMNAVQSTVVPMDKTLYNPNIFGGSTQLAGNWGMKKYQESFAFGMTNPAPNPFTFATGTQLPAQNNATGTIEPQRQGHISVLKAAPPPFTAVRTNGSEAPRQLSMLNTTKNTVTVSKVTQDPGLLMNVKTKTTVVSFPDPDVAQGMMGNIPNMDLLDTSEGGRVLSKSRKVVSPLQPVQNFHKEEDVCLLPKLEMLEMDDAKDQRRPSRKIAHGRRRSSNNKAMH